MLKYHCTQGKGVEQHRPRPTGTTDERGGRPPHKGGNKMEDIKRKSTKGCKEMEKVKALIFEKLDNADRDLKFYSEFIDDGILTPAYKMRYDRARDIMVELSEIVRDMGWFGEYQEYIKE